MAFIETLTVDYGLSEIGCRLYGGFTYSANRMADPECKECFIPLHNLATFYKKPMLYPHSMTYPSPICSINSENDETFVSRLERLPTDLFSDEDTYSKFHRNRNLLTGEIIGHDEMRLWFVDDNSPGKQLYEMPLKLNVPEDKNLPIKGKNISKLWSKRKEIKLSNQALELRVFDRQSKSGSLFVRTTHGLELYTSNTDTMSKLCTWPVTQFERVAYMDEVAVVDQNGNVFHSAIEPATFSRIKCTEKIHTVVSTDSPAQMLLASKANIYQADIREQTSATQAPFFDFDKESRQIARMFNAEGATFIKEREKIFHVDCLRPDTETYMVTGRTRIFVCDRRMPTCSLFYMNHQNIMGADYTTTTEPFIHNDPELHVYQFFALSRLCQPRLSQWAVGWNVKNNLWHSMGSLSQIESPQNVIDLCCAQFDLPYISADLGYKLPKYTRAFHYQHFPQNIRADESRALLFRQMDNGQIWLDTLQFASSDNDSKTDATPQFKRALLCSQVEKALAYVDNLPEEDFMKKLEPRMKAKVENAPEIINKDIIKKKMQEHHIDWMQAENTTYSSQLKEDIENLLEPLVDEDYADKITPEPELKLRHEQCLFSKIIIDMIPKAQRWMKIESGEIQPNSSDELSDEEDKAEETTADSSNLIFNETQMLDD